MLTLLSPLRHACLRGLRWLRGEAGEPPDAISLATIAKYLPENPVILEAGAHIGRDTEKMAHVWPQATIHAFEPIPALFRVLKERTSANPRIQCYPLAFSDKRGSCEMHVSGGTSDGSSSLDAPTGHLTEHPKVTFSSTCTVQTDTIDDWAASRGISRIDFMWLDLQGHELRVLRAAPLCLQTTRVIHAEVILKPLYAGCVLYPELRAWLEGQGFEVVCEALPWPDAGNVLFVHPDPREGKS
jgi:2-O-methyltransferase